MVKIKVLAQGRWPLIGDKITHADLEKSINNSDYLYIHTNKSKILYFTEPFKWRGLNIMNLVIDGEIKFWCNGADYDEIVKMNKI